MALLVGLVALFDAIRTERSGVLGNLAPRPISQARRFERVEGCRFIEIEVDHVAQ